MKLYDMKLAPNPRRVRMFLAEKGIDVPCIETDVVKGDNLKPAFLAVNPRGLIPTLQLDDGTVIDESVAICRYFEAVQPEPNLMGRTPVELGLIESWQRRIELDGMMAVAWMFRNSVPQFATRPYPGNKPGAAQMPELIERGRALLMDFYAMMDAHMADRAHVVCDRFTIADITLLVTLDFAKWVKMRPGPDHPNLLRWHESAQQRPSAAA